MVKVSYVESDGTEHQVDVALGYTVMDAAVNNGVPGIEADCGGACSCATCHVYIDQLWAKKLEPPSVMEESMLEFAVNATKNSRLACQIEITDQLDGLIVNLPDSQR